MKELVSVAINSVIQILRRTCFDFKLSYFIVDLREVKEVRPGRNSKDFEEWPEDASRFDECRCYVVLYGSDFCLKTLSVGGKSKL